MKKLSAIVISAGLLLPGIAGAVNDVTLTQGQASLSVNGKTFTITGGNALVDSITIDSTSFSFTMSGTSTMKVETASRAKLTASPDNLVTENICNSDLSSMTFGNPISGSKVVTVTVSSDTCSSVSSGSGGGGSVVGLIGSSGGGGGSSPTPSSLATVFTGTVPATQPAAGSSASAPFPYNLGRGAESSDVKRLQQLLNSDPATRIAETGVGSLGFESTYFGALTEAAVKKFQAKHGVVTSGTPDTTGYGLVGPATRAKLAEVFGSGVVVATPTPSTPSPASPSVVSTGGSFSRGLSRGTSHSDVKSLQQLLNSDPETRIADTGMGSPGSETDYYGSLTESAVGRFQVKYGIVGSASDPGYGYVGPATRAKLNEMSGGLGTSSPQSSTAGDASMALQKQIEDAMKQVQALQQSLGTEQQTTNTPSIPDPFSGPGYTTGP